VRIDCLASRVRGNPEIGCPQIAGVNSHVVSNPALIGTGQFAADRRPRELLPLVARKDQYRKRSRRPL
jgi:hypothetical protein